MPKQNKLKPTASSNTNIWRVSLACLPILFAIAACIFYSQNARSSLTNSKIEQPPSPTRRISHQEWDDQNPDINKPDGLWYDDKGLPLSYAAWRAKYGVRSAEPTARSTITKFGARVACWPSTGGIWIKHADPLEIDFLGLDRYKEVQRSSPHRGAAEDAFCNQLRMVGAQWWDLPPTFESRQGPDKFACETLEDCFEPQITNDLAFGWPEDGRGGCYVNLTKAEEKFGEGLKGYYNADLMDERCYVIQNLGGKWCRCRDECQEIAHLEWGDRDRGCSDPPLLMDLPKR